MSTTTCSNLTEGLSPCICIFTILPFYILMCLSTVYIYAHYAIDAIAGLLTGILLYFMFVIIYKKKMNGFSHR